MGLPQPLPPDPNAAIALLDERLRGQHAVSLEMKALVLEIQQRLEGLSSSLASRAQVDELRRELHAKVDSAEMRQKASDQQLLEQRMILQGPTGQPELGLLSRFGVVVERVKAHDQTRDRIIGWMIGAGMSGGVLATLAQAALAALR